MMPAQHSREGEKICVLVCVCARVVRMVASMVCCLSTPVAALTLSPFHVDEYFERLGRCALEKCLHSNVVHESGGHEGNALRRLYRF